MKRYKFFESLGELQLKHVLFRPISVDDVLKETENNKYTKMVADTGPTSVLKITQEIEENARTALLKIIEERTEEAKINLNQMSWNIAQEILHRHFR